MSGKLHFLPLPPRGKYVRYPLQPVVIWYKLIDVSEKSATSIFTYSEDRLCTLYIRLQSVICQKTLFLYIIYLSIHLFIYLSVYMNSITPYFLFCRLLTDSRRRWVDNIRMDLQKVGCGYMD